jgi:hypothetical protein
LGVVIDGGCMCLWSCKICSFANFFCYLECGGVG